VAHDYLTVADVLGMHAVLMQRYGGAPGIRDPGALEAALFRPQTGYYEDIVMEAAALMESLANNHPFVDGNKRPQIIFPKYNNYLRTQTRMDNSWRPSVSPASHLRWQHNSGLDPDSLQDSPGISQKRTRHSPPEHTDFL